MGCGFAAGTPSSEGPGNRAADSSPIAPAPPDSQEPGFASENDDLLAARAAPGSCGDGIDNDDDGIVDCLEDSCASAPVCCIGTTACCVPAADSNVPASVSFVECEDQSLRDCSIAETAVFGEPRVEGGFFRPGGEVHDAGIVVGQPVDLRSDRLTVSAKFQMTTGCGAGCIDGTSLAVVAEGNFGDAAHVEPLASLSMSAGRSMMLLRIGSVVVESWEIDAALVERWQLNLDPTGLVEVLREGAALFTTEYLPTAGAQIVAYGRSSNFEGEAHGTGLADIEVAVSRCDNPGAWSGAAALDAPGASFPVPANDAVRRGGMSITEIDGRTVVAFADEGKIYMYFQTDGEPEWWNDGEPVLEMSDAWLSDPEIFVRDGEPELYYTLTFDAEGSGVAYSVPSGDGFAANFTWIANPREHDDIDSFSMPTVAGAEGATILIARASRGSESQLIPFFTREAEVGIWQRFVGSEIEKLLVGGDPSSDTTSFATDSVGGPSLLVYGGAFHLYVAGRRGTRWSIGQFISADLLHWRAVTQLEDGSGAVFLNGGQVFDTLGALDPDVRLLGSELEMVYAGTNGIDTQFAAVRRPLARIWR